jgi:hypothetical protein
MLTGSILVGLGPCRLAMDRLYDFAETHIVLHRKRQFGDDFARMTANDRCLQDTVLAGHGQDSDKNVRHAIGNRAVEIVEVIVGNVVRTPFAMPPLRSG